MTIFGGSPDDALYQGLPPIFLGSIIFAIALAYATGNSGTLEVCLRKGDIYNFIVSRSRALWLSGFFQAGGIPGRILGFAWLEIWGTVAGDFLT